MEYEPKLGPEPRRIVALRWLVAAVIVGVGGDQIREPEVYSQLLPLLPAGSLVATFLVRDEGLLVMLAGGSLLLTQLRIKASYILLALLLIVWMPEVFAFAFDRIRPGLTLPALERIGPLALWWLLVVWLAVDMWTNWAWVFDRRLKENHS